MLYGIESKAGQSLFMRAPAEALMELGSGGSYRSGLEKPYDFQIWIGKNRTAIISARSQYLDPSRMFPGCCRIELRCTKAKVKFLIGGGAVPRRLVPDDVPVVVRNELVYTGVAAKE
jgi:hypothetical protein